MNTRHANCRTTRPSLFNSAYVNDPMSRAISNHRLDAEGLTSRTNDLALDVVPAEQGVLRDLAGGKVALGSSVLAAVVGHV